MTRPLRGFSLVEMAVVLAIVGLLLGGLMMTLSAQQSVQRTQETRRLLVQAREALVGHAAIHGRLPCPAEPTLASGVAGAGIERTPNATGCAGGESGVLPWATLGLPETDAWGRRFSYRVSPDFARSVAAPAKAAFALDTVGDNTVRVAAAGVALADAVPAVIVSHGANGAGAYNASGTMLPASADADEIENHDGDSDFVDKTPTESYDDLVEWLATPTLMNRMLQAGRLP